MGSNLNDNPGSDFVEIQQGLHLQRLMWSPMVVEPNPVSQHSSRMLHCFKPLPVNTLLLDRSNDPLHQSVLLRTMRRDEFLLQAVAPYKPGVAATREDQPVIASQKKRSGHTAQGAIAVDQRLLQCRLRSRCLGRSR